MEGRGFDGRAVVQVREECRPFSGSVLQALKASGQVPDYFHSVCPHAAAADLQTDRLQQEAGAAQRTSVQRALVKNSSEHVCRKRSGSTFYEFMRQLASLNAAVAPRY